MKYIKLKTPEEWQLLYSKYNTLAEIAMGIGEYVDLFSTERYCPFDPKSLMVDKNNLFVIKNNKGLSIWEIGNKAKDMNGSEIPNVYLVRKVGYVF